MASRGDTPYFEVSATDRAMALVGERSSATPYLVLELSGELDRTALTGAMELLAVRHPILGCTVDARASRARWQPDTTAPELSWRDTLDHDEPDLDVRRGPTCRAVHEAGPCGHRLRFGIHHAVGDATGLLALADDLRRLYCILRRGDTPLVDVDWSPRNVGALLDAHRVGWVDRVALAWEVQRRWNALQPSTHAAARGAPSPGARPSRFPARAMSAGALEAALAWGRDRGWRANHVLLAALARGWRDAFGDESSTRSASSWLVSVDCRRALGVTRGIGNLSGFEPVSLRDIETRGEAESVDDVRASFAPLRRVGAGMVGELGGPLLDFVPPRLLEQTMETAFDLRARVSRCTRIYSGVELPAVLGDWEDVHATTAYCEGSPRMAPPFIAIVVTRFRDDLACTPVAAPEVLSAAEADALVAATGAQLAALAADAGVPG